MWRKGCTYSAMTKDALFKHLVKLHNYTDDMLSQMKDQFNVAPFSCQKCSKAFTRNSNLKAHYLTVHNFSQEDIKKIKWSLSPITAPRAWQRKPLSSAKIPNSVKNTPLMVHVSSKAMLHVHQAPLEMLMSKYHSASLHHLSSNLPLCAKVLQWELR